MKIIVTGGGAGFIGSNALQSQQVSDLDWQCVTVLDFHKLTYAGNRANPDGLLPGRSPLASLCSDL